MTEAKETEAEVGEQVEWEDGVKDMVEDGEGAEEFKKIEDAEDAEDVEEVRVG